MSFSSSQRAFLRTSKSEVLLLSTSPRRPFNSVPREFWIEKRLDSQHLFPPLKTELNDLVHDILLDRQTLSRGYFNRVCVENLIREHSDSERFPKEILSLISLELWHRAFIGKTDAASDVLIPTAAVES